MLSVRDMKIKKHAENNTDVQTKSKDTHEHVIAYSPNTAWHPIMRQSRLDGEPLQKYNYANKKPNM